MTTVYPSAQRILAELNSVWTDLTNYWVEDLTGLWGIQGNGPLDLVGDTGVLRLTLNNMDQRFDPDSTSALAGWEKGIRIKLEIDYDGNTYTWLGTVNDIDIPLSDDLVDRAFVAVADWMEYAAKHPIVNPGIISNQRGDDVIRTTLGLMPIQPAATDLDVGDSLFPATFDTNTTQTKAYTEFSKVAFSEPGYIYLRKDQVHGEMLVFENASHRNGLHPVAQVPVLKADSGFLLKEDGGHLLKEDGGRIILNKATEFVMDNSMLDLETEHGKRVVNYFSVTANPRRLGDSLQILFQLDEPLLIGSGETIVVKGTFVDPVSGNTINGQDMIPPVINTDYKVWTNNDATGIDITSDLVLDSTPYGTDGFEHQVTNNSIYAGYITRYNTRGYAVFTFNTIDYVAKSNASIEKHGYLTESMDQLYQTSLFQGRVFVERVVDAEKQPRTVLNKVTFLANESHELMMACLNFGPGNLVHIKHTKRGIDGLFYIQGIADFKLSQGGLMLCTWWLKETYTLARGQTLLGVEFKEASGSQPTYIDFGTLRDIIDQPKRSFSFWISKKTAIYADSGVMGFISDTAGVLIDFDAIHNAISFQCRYTGNDLLVRTTNPVIASNDTWYHVVVTWDISSDPNAYPIIYIDGGSAEPLTVFAPTGYRLDEAGTQLLFGNLYLVSTGYFNNQFTGILKDCRIYNRILSQAEAATLHTEGAGGVSVTDGMVFQTFAVRTKELSQYVNATLTDDLKVQDVVIGLVGTPYGEPVGRAI